MSDPSQLSRRRLLALGATAGAAALVGLPLRVQASTMEVKTMEPKLLTVPESLPEKVFNTEKVGIGRRTHEEHLKLWQGYARKTNEIRQALANATIDPTKANQIFSEHRSLKADYSFAYEGYINHELYFNTIGGEGGEPTGDLASLITESYGGFGRWADDLRATGMAARGWVFTAFDHAEQRLFNYLGDAQNTFPIWNHTLILGMDVYEHAYYIDFGSARAKYIEAFLQTIDWKEVEKRFATARRLAGAHV